eukprot:TRINITY_DN6192_c0_g1_i1.p1 TRINITY_DN6192_c0_g1~~TRINITY_DN6192_c0_g1_i1.p1  ORF type:complete len:193 (-),score=19.76 TRINITY_DN6192_c0_g1_i1:112-690(-)
MGLRASLAWWTRPCLSWIFFPTVLDTVRGDGASLRTDREKAFDGKSLVPLLTSKSDAMVHDVLYHYCGDRLVAARHGQYKAHWVTVNWQEGYDHCPDSVICGCEGEFAEVQSPPLLFDLDTDPGEDFPLSTDSDVYKSTMSYLESAKNEHLAGVTPAYNQLEVIAHPWLMPCCNFPLCQCEEDEQHMAPSLV